MRFKVERHGIEVTPENEQDVAYIEDTLGLKKKGDSIALERHDVIGVSSLALLRAEPFRHPFPHSYTRVYICHPYSANPTGNRIMVAGICRELLKERKDVLLIAPQLFMADMLPDELTQQERVIAMCCDLIRTCDEVWWYGGPSPGCNKEIEFAKGLGKRVVQHWRE